MKHHNSSSVEQLKIFHDFDSIKVKSTIDLLVHFLHDVIAVEATAGHELHLKEEDFRKLAEEYASKIEKNLGA